jgi:hypothetical protein
MSAATDEVLRSAEAFDLRRRSLQMVLRACSRQLGSRNQFTATYTPVLAIAAIGLEGEIALDLFLQIRQVCRIETLQDTFRVDHVESMLVNVLVVDRLCGVDEAQRNGEPVDGLCAATLDAQSSLGLCLLQDEAILVGDPGLFGRVGRALGWIVATARVGGPLGGYC